MEIFYYIALTFTFLTCKCPFDYFMSNLGAFENSRNLRWPPVGNHNAIPTFVTSSGHVVDLEGNSFRVLFIVPFGC